MEPLGTDCVGLTYCSSYESTTAHSFQSHPIIVHYSYMHLYRICMVQTAWYEKDREKPGQSRLAMESHEIRKSNLFTFSIMPCYLVL